MDPALDEASYRFISLSPEDGLSGAIERPFAMVSEDEGMTLVVPSEELQFDGPIVTEKDGIPQIRPASTQDASGQLGQEFARITLQVHSDLEAVGLTAAVATALADHDVACNVIAGFHHDHLFVPWPLREQALAILQALAHDAGR